VPIRVRHRPFSADNTNLYFPVALMAAVALARIRTD
jgi:hypothetical protein